MFRGPVSALTVLAMLLARQAAADITHRNDTGGGIACYGPISRRVTSVDDGVAHKNSFADNAHSKPRPVSAPPKISRSSARSPMDPSRDDFRRVDLQLKALR